MKSSPLRYYDSSGEDDSPDEELVYNGTQETLETSLSKYSSDLYTFDLDCDCNLPLELFLHIFYFLNQSDLVHKIALLNKCFRQLIFNQKLSHLVWDFRLIHFNSSADCVDVCVKKEANYSSAFKNQKL